jgi:hypothetical protein
MRFSRYRTVAREGGTKIEGVVMDGHSRLVVRERVATPQSDAIQKRPKSLNTREP